MTPVQVGQLLTVAALADGRQITAEMCTWWHELIGDIPFEDAKRALADHQRESTKNVRPADIRSRVAAYRKALEPVPTMSPETPEDCGHHRWIADGTCMYCTTKKGR